MVVVVPVIDSPKLAIAPPNSVALLESNVLESITTLLRL